MKYIFFLTGFFTLNLNYPDLDYVRNNNTGIKFEFEHLYKFVNIHFRHYTNVLKVRKYLLMR